MVADTIPDPGKAMTMRAVLAAFRADDALDPKRRSLVAADVEQAFLRKPGLSQAEACGQSVRPMLDKLGNTKRDLNIRSNVRVVIRWAAEKLPRDMRLTPLTAQWQALLDKSELKLHDKAKLTRFFRHLSRLGISPDQVSDAHVDEYMAHIARLGTVDDLSLHRRDLVRVWNGRNRIITGWPTTKLNKPVRQKALKAPHLKDLGTALSASIRECFEVLKCTSSPRASQGSKRFDRRRPVDGGPRPTRDALAESTAISYERYLRRATKIISEELEIPYEKMTLRTVVTAGNVELTLNVLDQQLTNDGKGERSLNLMGSALRTVAKDYLCLPKDELDEIWWLVQQLTKPQPKLTKKNIERLRALALEKRLKLFRLPSILINGALKAIKNGGVTRKLLADAKIGVAIAILLNIPLRKGNLVALRLGVHIDLPETVGEEGRLTLPAAMVKNNEGFDRPIPADLVALLKIYISEILPLVRSNPDSNALFPGPGPNSTTGATRFGVCLSERIAKHLNIEMNAHLFRHFAAIVYLEDNPGEYEVVRLLLGNRDLTIVKAYYTGLEKDSALRKVTASLARHKRDAGLNPRNMLMVDQGASQRTARRSSRKAA